MKRDIDFSGDITPDRVKDLLNNLRGHPVGRRVWISSAGGAFECFSIYGPPIQRIGFISIGAKVESAANILYLLGHNRLALSDSHFFFHEVRAVIRNRSITLTTVEDALDYEREISRRHEGVEELLRQMRNAQDWYISFICQRAKITKAALTSLMRAEATLSAREAVRYGIAHRIVSSDEISHC